MQDSNRFPGAFLVAVDELASDSKTKQHILVGLSAALSALSRRMQSQGDNATQITFLAVRAEKIADRAWALNASSNQHFDRDSQALAAEVKAFAATAAAASLRAGEQALLGREVALAIGAHADDISLLARDIHALPDAAAVRARLRPLSNTLSQLPERLKASAVTAREVGDIAALALGLGARADRLATGGLNASKEAAAHRPWPCRPSMTWRRKRLACRGARPFPMRRSRPTNACCCWFRLRPRGSRSGRIPKPHRRRTGVPKARWYRDPCPVVKRNPYAPRG
jgi:hypothetical protein